jgi:phenylacetate-CoA ligase
LIELRRDQRLDVLRLLVEARPESADEASRAAQATLLASHIRQTIGVGVEIVVGDPGSIERSAGKAKRISDLRPKG